MRNRELQTYQSVFVTGLWNLILALILIFTIIRIVLILILIVLIITRQCHAPCVQCLCRKSRRPCRSCGNRTANAALQFNNVIMIMIIMMMARMAMMMMEMMMMMMGMCKCWALAYHANPLKSPVSCGALLDNRMRDNEETERSSWDLNDDDVNYLSSIIDQLSDKRQWRDRMIVMRHGGELDHNDNVFCRFLSIIGFETMMMSDKKIQCWMIPCIH